MAEFILEMNYPSNGLLRLSVEYATREVSLPSFTVKTLLLSGGIELVSIGKISCY